jgi:hypothetical protein
VEQDVPKFGADGAGFDYSVENRLILHVVLREAAEALIRGGAGAADAVRSVGGGWRATLCRSPGARTRDSAVAWRGGRIRIWRSAFRGGASPLDLLQPLEHVDGLGRPSSRWSSSLAAGTSPPFAADSRADAT